MPWGQGAENICRIRASSFAHPSSSSLWSRPAGSFTWCPALPSRFQFCEERLRFAALEARDSRYLGNSFRSLSPCSPPPHAYSTVSAAQVHS